MKRYYGRDGAQRLWFEPAEIEECMEAELERAKLFPTVEMPAVRIEEFVERHLQAQLDQYADLEPCVLGLTEFRVGAKPRILINKDLTGSALDEDDSPPGLLGRWRSTLAHEGAHVILHRCLFDLNPAQGKLFGDNDGEERPGHSLQRCLKRDIAFGSTGNEWREVQANMGMAALLMPRSVFIGVLHQEMERAGETGIHIAQNSREHQKYAALLGARFSVSKQAAAIRLVTLGLLSTAGQGHLI